MNMLIMNVSLSGMEKSNQKVKPVLNNRTKETDEFEKKMIKEHPDWIRYIRNPSKELCEIAIEALVERQAKRDLLEISITEFIQNFRKNSER